jgi:hypothetical protein
MNPIFAKAKLILKNGLSIDYRCITKLEVKTEHDTKMLCINGETDDSFDMPQIVYDKHFTKDILMLIAEFYEPK